MRAVQRTLYAVAAAGAAVVMTAGTSLAHECVNASKKNQLAGAQLVLGDSGIIWMTNGVANRIEQGIIDPDSGEGFSGLVAFDIDGDDVGDVSTWIVGPNGEIPLKAQFNGQPCKGVTNIGVWFEQCLASAS